MRPTKLTGKVAIAIALLLACCSRDSGRGSPATSASTQQATDAAAPTATAAAVGLTGPGVTATSSSAAGSPAGDAGSPAERLELLRFRFTSEVRGKEPTDKLASARPGQRVWAHLTLRNRTDWSHTLKVSFSVNGQARTTVDLDVEPSWSYRTFAYVTLRPTDTAGALTVRVTDDEDNAEIVASKLAIRP